MADNHWRHTANAVRAVSIDARAFCPFPFLLIIKSLFILVLGVIFVVFFFIIERRGYSWENFLRKLRGWFVGPIKTVRRY